MTRIVELAAGHETRLSAEVLRLRLVGTAKGAVLVARDEHGADITFRRIDVSTILVHPSRGAASIVVMPGSGARFGPATRVGIDVQVEGASAGRQVIVSQADVGALNDYEVARLEPLDGAEWLVVAANGPSGGGRDRARGQSRPGLDERRYPWLAAGRYAVRGARGGAGAESTGSPWALVLDGSVSMQSVFTLESLARRVELVAGILSESTGRLPAAMYTTGVAAPVRVEGAIERPAAAVESAFQCSRPPTWSIVAPSIAVAVQSGAQLVALVTDGVPGDVRDLAELVAKHPDTQLIVVTVGQSRFALPGRATSTGLEELGGLMEIEHAPNVSVVAVDPGTAADAADNLALADFLLRIA